MRIIKTYLYWGKNIISVLFGKLLLPFGFKYDNSVIPEGPYCYVSDVARNKIKKEGEAGVYYIIPCKYFIILSKRWRACKYLGIITDDFVFRDQCKMCGENDDYKNYEE